MTDSQTSITLLTRMRSDTRDEAAWREFAERYGSRIYRWCESRRLPPSDAEDVTQEVLLKLARHFRKFEYDPNLSFRAWLRRLTENAISDFFRSHSSRERGQGGTSVINLMAAEPAQVELTEYLAEAFDLELFDEAKNRVQQRVNGNRWKSWDLLSNQAMSGKEVAQQLGIPAAVVYANKNQVQKLIKEEIEVLESGLPCTE